MEGSAVPEELRRLRAEIDQIDDDIIQLLGKRFDVTRQVGLLKAEKQLNSVDPERERQKLEHLRQQAEALSLNPEFVLSLFGTLFAEVVSNHKRFLAARQEK